MFNWSLKFFYTIVLQNRYFTQHESMHKIGKKINMAFTTKYQGIVRFVS